MQQAGRNDLAEQTYQQLLSDPQADPLQAVISYAGYLRSTERASQGEKLLTGYLAGHSDLDPMQEANALNFLAGMTADPQRAGEYPRAAAEKWPKPPAAVPNSIAEAVAAAQTAANEGRFDEAFSLSLHAIDIAPMARDRESIASWGLLQVAGTIAQKQPARAEELYQRVLAAVEGWSADTIQPLSRASEAYIGFLMGRPDRREAVPAVLERYGNVVASARGADAGAREVLNRTIDLERMGNSWERAIFLAQEMLRLEESLGGTTTQPYLNAVGALAGLYSASGDPERALPLYRQMAAISDLIATPNDPQPARLRMNAAVAFAGQRQFDEADRLAREAVAIEKGMRRPTDNFTGTLEQIREMEKASQ